MKHLSVIGTTAEIIGAGLFVSSFFVEDNKKAVRRRWIGFGIGAAGYGLKLYAFMKSPKTATK